ncbi:MAG: carboxypeptidase-like regulatory domain-containing protein [Flavobacteriaceae bacterium]|nr:carboxypeptidase-like regulatory domain-containing protein [Flavobacteriaceae bacterium]
MLIFKNELIFIFLFFISTIFSQNISGVVFDGITEKPLEGASVYFDNTTIGTTSDSNGEFTIEYHKELKTPLVVSFVGYQTSINENYSKNTKLKIYLYESSIVLNEITIDPNDDWSKDLKLKEFKKHYLGESKNGKACKLLNEEDILLKYNKKTKKLTAKAKGPVYIRNENLKYLILVELQHFEVNYSHVSKNKKHLNLAYISYSGNSFFQSLQKNPNTIIKDIRKKTYLGSTLHFMRALSTNQLEKEGYSIYLENTKVDPKKYISVFPTGNLNSVKVKLRRKLYIKYKNGKESSIESLAGMFYIDDFGNYSPVDKVRFGGEMGSQRMGDTLPLDFLL